MLVDGSQNSESWALAGQVTGLYSIGSPPALINHQRLGVAVVRDWMVRYESAEDGRVPLVDIVAQAKL